MIDLKLYYFDKYEDFINYKLPVDSSNTTYRVGINGVVFEGAPDISWNTVVFIGNVQKVWRKGKLEGYGGRAERIYYENSESDLLADNLQDSTDELSIRVEQILSEAEEYDPTHKYRDKQLVTLDNKLYLVRIITDTSTSAPESYIQIPDINEDGKFDDNDISSLSNLFKQGIYKKGIALNQWYKIKNVELYVRYYYSLVAVDNSTLYELATDTTAGLFLDVPNDDKQYVRKNQQWKEISDVEIGATVLSVISSLLTEVAKLRNSFLYGINSYTGVDTAAGRVVNGMQYVDDEEPLWAIEEDDLALSYMTSLDVPFDTSTPIVPNNNTTLDITKDLKIGISDATWTDTEEIIKLDTTSYKHLLYLTTTGLDITLTLGADLVSDILIPLSNITKGYSVSTYNILLIFSKKIDQKGSNYLYVSVDNAITGLNIVHGYYSNGELTSVESDFDYAYYLKSINFKNLDITKFNFYTKNQDFSNEVISSAPKELDYKYSAAHITIREVKDESELESILSHLLTPELVWIKSTSTLKINTADGIYTVGSTSNNNSENMSNIQESLADLGIVYNSTSKNLTLSPVESMTFVNSENKQYKVFLDSEGNLITRDATINSLTLPSGSYPTTSTSLSFKDDYNRGFVAKLRYSLNSSALGVSDDWGLNSDRVKIGSVYMNFGTTDYGCTHAFIELENNDIEHDFDLSNCKIAFTYQNTSSVQQMIGPLSLSGTIPAGGTYLIRGKKYTDDAFIKVNSFDIEWSELDTNVPLNTKCDIGFILYYDDGTVTLDASTKIYTKFSQVSDAAVFGSSTSASSLNDSNIKDKNDYTYKWYYIDSFAICCVGANSGNWFPKTGFKSFYTNALYKNTFELDPAKQAFLALSGFDSSRYRNNKEQDSYVIPLNNSTIKFSKSFDAYPVNKFTPKASFEGKNVCTDKTQFDCEKPNMTTCSFGINIHTTRCFNWISAGTYNEYVFIKNGDSWERFESYGGYDNDISSSWTKKTISTDAEKVIYNRIVNKFPATDITYTAHKCIINHIAVTTPTTFTYVVGRAKQDGTPDFEHCSDEMTFTLYPDTYTPRVYQITDQQGFHWVEYLVWAASAIELNKKITEDCKANNIIPILINTGDMTLNGSRINEWLDYYNAGISLFNHLEQMNCVGNNDLCNISETNLGTGDDPGKSNPYYFHVFYCYELPNPENFVINNKYIPSTYYFGNDKYKFLVVNSELTFAACRNVYGQVVSDDNTTDTILGTINLYTGYKVYNKVNNDDTKYEITYSSNKLTGTPFTPIYNVIYKWLYDTATITDNLVTSTSCNWIAACHEMPFTVITSSNLKIAKKAAYRSASGTSLVGSHLNLLNTYDVASKGIYWFSRLLEYFKVKLCIGGHKHTYMCTFPVRENFTFGTNKFSSTEQYIMPSSLDAGDNIGWIYDNKNTTKYPLTKFESEVSDGSLDIFPGVKYTGDKNTVTYFMCQATGYKLKSNKELPSYTQVFSKVVAGNNLTSSSAEGTAEKAQYSQLFPMFGIIYPESNRIQLVRINNILNISIDNAESFTPTSFNSENSNFSYFDASNIQDLVVVDNTVEGYPANSTTLKTCEYWVSDNTKYIV